MRSNGESKHKECATDIAFSEWEFGTHETIVWLNDFSDAYDGLTTK